MSTTLIDADPATGRILQTYTTPHETIAVDVAPDPATHYVADGAVAARPEHPDLAVSTVTAGVALGGFPAGWPARLLLEGEEAARGDVPPSGALIFGDAGAWVVEVLEAWPIGPHRPRSYAVTVTEPEPEPEP